MLLEALTSYLLLLPTSCLYVPPYLLTYLLAYLLTYLPTYLLTHLLTCLLTYLLTYLGLKREEDQALLNHLLTYLLAYLLRPQEGGGPREGEGARPRSADLRPVAVPGVE